MRVPKIDRDYLQANLNTVVRLLSTIPETDYLSRISLEDRRDELLRELNELESVDRPLAAMDLFFGGDPVHGMQGIQAEFGGVVLEKFQDLVAKVSASGIKELADTGVVPKKELAALHVTSIIKGSFGFHLEEMDAAQTVMLSSRLKESVEESAEIMASLDVLDEETFEAALGSIDKRVVGAIQTLFEAIWKAKGTMRVVCGDSDREYNGEAIHRVYSRIRETDILEEHLTLVGALRGILPEGRNFEFTTDSGQTVKGKAPKTINEGTILRWQKLEHVPGARAAVQRRLLRRPGKQDFVSWSLLDLAIEPAKAPFEEPPVSSPLFKETD